jgi:hypothetical protein
MASLRGIAAVAAVVLIFPATAPAAKKVIAPPGNSGIDQYVPSIPTASGNSPVTSRLRSTGGAPALSRPNRRALNAQGKAGRATKRFADATAPRHTAPIIPPALAQGGSPLNAAGDATIGAGVGGMGIALPILLGLTALGAALFGLQRRRARTAGPGEADGSGEPPEDPAP